MTKKQRAQVVELLRCAADSRVDGVGLNGMWDGANLVCPTETVERIAWDAVMSLQRSSRPRQVVGVVDEHYRHELLEAAQRVEEGSWP